MNPVDIIKVLAEAALKEEIVRVIFKNSPPLPMPDLLIHQVRVARKYVVGTSLDQFFVECGIAAKKDQHYMYSSNLESLAVVGKEVLVDGELGKHSVVISFNADDVLGIQTRPGRMV